ncbi:RNA polymerase sigma factor [Compostibacter hankyongensis]|uniref:RNA polymerase sigma factor n=1 Tax=Compostibacter hankyongensis TaxID=1007089 RepID=A0ABP8FK19_9BACT
MHLQIFQQQVLPARDKLYRLALQLLGDPEEARDVVQEVLLRIWSSREQLPEYHHVEAWCMRMARNLCLDKLKAGKVRKAAIPEISRREHAPVTPLQQTEYRQQRDYLRRVVAMLPEKHRIVWHLRDVEGYSYQEIAGMAGMSLDEVKVNLFRARKAVKEKLTQIDLYGIP